jgi:hypothetical protein
VKIGQVVDCPTIPTFTIYNAPLHNIVTAASSSVVLSTVLAMGHEYDCYCMYTSCCTEDTIQLYMVIQSWFKGWMI